MVITEEIEYIKRELQSIDDEDLVRTIRDLLEYAKKKTVRDSLQPMSVEELHRRAHESEAAIVQGRVTGIEDLEIESSRW